MAAAGYSLPQPCGRTNVPDGPIRVYALDFLAAFGFVLGDDSAVSVREALALSRRAAFRFRAARSHVCCRFAIPPSLIQVLQVSASNLPHEPRLRTCARRGNNKEASD